MTLMEISAASSRLAFRNEIAARSSKLRQMVADGKERLANADPKKIEDDPKLRAIEIMIPRVETELDDLAIAPAILPSVPWNTVELYAAIAAIGFQLITLVQAVQWYWIRHEPKGLQGRP